MFGRSQVAQGSIRHSSQKDRRKHAQAAISVAALLVISLVPANRVAAVTTYDAFVYDGWPHSTFPGRLGVITGPGTVTGQVSAGYLYVEANDGSSFWTLGLKPDDGSDIGPGSYTSPTDSWLGVSVMGSVGCSGPAGQLGTIVIESISTDSAGAVTELTADFDYRCTTTNPPPVPAHGQVRIHSTTGYSAIEIEPQHDDVPAPDHGFGVIDVGASSDPWPISVTNRGTVATTVSGTASGSGFVVLPGSCDGSLQPGARCTIDVGFSPTDAGPVDGQVHVLTPDLSLVDRALTLTGTGFSGTSVSLVVDQAEDGGVPGAALYTTTLTPPNAHGWMEIERTCGTGVQFGPVSIGISLWTPPGACTATVSFVGAEGWGSSSSGPVAFTMPTTSAVLLQPGDTPFVHPTPTAITATVLAGNAAVPTSGSLTIEDLTTSTVLASGPISAMDQSISVSTTLPVGSHEIRATFSGGDGIVGSSATSTYLIAADTFPPIGTLSTAVAASTANVTIHAEAHDYPVDVVASLALSNDGEHWLAMPYAASTVWDVTNPEAGGSAADGSHPVFAKWADAFGNWSSPESRTLLLDRGIPVGSVVIDNGATTTGLTTVALSVVARDDVTGVSQVALSNDGTSWTTRQYAASQVWTLPATNGTRTVFARWRDGAGNWSAVRSDTITLDSTRPVVTSGSVTATPDASLAASGAIPIKLTWAGADTGTGIARFDLLRSVDSGAWVSMGPTMATSLTQYVSSGHAYSFRVRAFDKAGNSSQWRAIGAFTATLAPETSTRVAYTGAWSSYASSSLTGGKARRASAVNAKATYSFTGRAVAWVAAEGPTFGSVKVYIDGAYVGTVSLYRTASVARTIAFTKAWPAHGAHTITLVNVGTVGHPFVNVDGFVSFDGRPTGTVIARR